MGQHGVDDAIRGTPSASVSSNRLEWAVGKWILVFMGVGFTLNGGYPGK
jgi:hypothetical protein